MLSKTIDRRLFDRDRLTPEDVRAFVKRYRHNPNLFCSEVLEGVENDVNQINVCNAINENSRVSVASAMGTGKTFLAAALALWFFSTRSNAKVVVTANTGDQLRNTLFPYIRRLAVQSKIHSWLDAQATAVYLKGETERGGIQQLIWNEANPDASRGAHAEHLLIIVDEASGVADIILDNLDSTLTQSENKILLFSNPSRNSGYFFNSFSDPRYTNIRLTYENSRWTNKEHGKQLIAKHGRDSDIVRVNLFGEFPLHSSYTILSTSEINDFLSEPEDSEGRAVIGVDIGGGGDKTVWAVRKGMTITSIEEASTPSEAQIIDITKRMIAKHSAVAVNIDETGIGYFIPRNLRQQIKGVEINGVNFGEASPAEDCKNMRAYLYKRLKDLVGEGLKMGRNDNVRSQLIATEYSYDDRGRWQLVSKEKIIKAVGHSPDELDAIALTCAPIKKRLPVVF